MDDLAGVPAPTVPGHGGTVASVDVDGTPLLVLTGPQPPLRGPPASTVVHAVRAAVLSGCPAVLLTNAAGSLRPEVGVGRAVVISDQLNLTGANPMCGDEPPGPPGNRFVDLTNLYSPRLRAAALAARRHRHRGRVRRAAGGQLRDAGRDPDAAHPGRRPGGHVHRARGHRRAPPGRRGVRRVAGDQPGRRSGPRDRPPRGPHGRRGRRGHLVGLLRTVVAAL